MKMAIERTDVDDGAPNSGRDSRAPRGCAIIRECPEPEGFILSPSLSLSKINLPSKLGLDPTEISNGKPWIVRSSMNWRSYPLVTCIFVDVRVCLRVYAH